MAQYQNTWFNEELRENQRNGFGRLRTSSESSLVSGVINQKIYSISASYTIQPGNYIALNISPASDIIITKIVTNSEFSIEVYSSHSTGSPDGLFSSSSMNLLSIDESPTSAQVFYAATPVGKRIDFGHASINTAILAGIDSKPSIAIKNDTLDSDLIEIQVVYEEVSERSSLFGLTASTLLESFTEMANYG